MKTVLFATDGSESSARALAFAIDLAQEPGVALHVLSVGSPRVRRLAGPHSSLPPELEGADRSEHIADADATRARAAGVEATSHVSYGDVVTCILEAATVLQADMLVVGSRGLGSVSGATLGSVSQALVRRCPVPVTVVRYAPRVASALRT
jgi:nucleotide-binding universal stress UspA family protein